MDKHQAAAPCALIVGSSTGTGVGGSLFRGAIDLGWNVVFQESARAHARNRLVRRLFWTLRDKRPLFLARFERETIDLCGRLRPSVVLCTGCVPLRRAAVRALRSLGASVRIFLTDDPWNGIVCSHWFREALTEFDIVFSPRKSTNPDLARLGSRIVRYVPFGYDDRYFRRLADDELERFRRLTSWRCFFAGGADRERVAVVEVLLRAGVSVGLFGGYWDRYAGTKPYARGFCPAEDLAGYMQACELNLCIGRQANRDGHAMRSWEVPAAGGVILAENTEDHRAMFGEEGHSALFFSNPGEMVSQARRIIAKPAESRAMAERAFFRITNGRNTYRDRVQTMLSE